MSKVVINLCNQIKRFENLKDLTFSLESAIFVSYDVKYYTQYNVLRLLTYRWPNPEDKRTDPSTFKNFKPNKMGLQRIESPKKKKRLELLNFP